jgi:peptidyl-prolyl cis-trans isomerase C
MLDTDSIYDYICTKIKKSIERRRFAMTKMYTGSVIISMLCVVFSSAMAVDANMPTAVPTAEPNFASLNPDEVMAKYGDQKLTLKEIMYFIPAPTNESAKQLAQQWLDLQMVYETAKNRGLTDDPKLKALAEIRSKQVFMGEMMNKVANEVNIPEAAVREYYDKNKDTDPLLKDPLRLSFTHIKTKTLEEANSVKKRIEAGEDIEMLAKQLSKAPDAKNGGVVKRFPLTVLEQEYGKEFADALTAASEGKIIGPIKVRDGFEVARHEGKLAAKVKTFEQVAAGIKNDLEEKAKMEATKNFMEKTKKEFATKMYLSPLLETPAPKAEDIKSAKEPNLPVDKTKTKTDNTVQKK